VVAKRSDARSDLVDDLFAKKVMTLEQIDTPVSTDTEESVPTPTVSQPAFDHDRSPETGQATRKRPVLHRVSVLVLVVGLLVTGVVTAISRLNYVHNEQHLSDLQANLTASAFGVAPVDLERRLGEAAGEAGEASDPASTFQRVIGPSMAPAGPFTSASLAFVHGGQVQVLARVGAKPIRNPTSKATLDLYARAAKSGSLVTTRVEGNGLQRLAYLMPVVGPGGTYVAAAGQALPSNRRIRIPANSPDAGLNLAIYFGKTVRPAALIETNVSHLPLGGTVSTATVPFGSSQLTLVMSPMTPLAGQWSERLPWGILVVGLLFTLAVTVMTERLIRRREIAEQLADENRHLYGEQRNVSLTLQRSLLPKALPSIEGVEFAARYIPGESGIEVGGDWYSAIAIDDRRFAFVVGDVSGRGLAAATIMAGLRYTIRAYAAIGYSPERILQMAAKEINIDTDRHFATVLVGVVDNDRREITMANAGHLPALVLSDGRSEFVEVPVGVPLGVGSPVYESTTLPIRPNSTLIAYTDGLVEKRNENLDAGLDRLRKAASFGAPSADELLTNIAGALLSDHGSDDDTAILAIRWLD
jgi:serine phosphatase RsbU (regulator of sigma subunit)